LFFFLGIFAAIALPTYKAYVERAQESIEFIEEGN
jgi:Tfp pilus assembly protein PilE